MTDLKTQELKEHLIILINNSELPLTIINYVLKEIQAEAQSGLYKAINQQKLAREQLNQQNQKTEDDVVHERSNI